MTRDEAAAFAAELELDVDDIAICHACLSFDISPRAKGDLFRMGCGSPGRLVSWMYDNCDTLVEVAERPISLRLDEEATRALELLMRDGKSRSEAIREAVVDTARRRRYELAAADAARVGADEGDRREVAAVQALMEELSEER